MSRISALLLYRGGEEALLGRVSRLQDFCAGVENKAGEGLLSGWISEYMAIGEEILRTAMAYGFSGNLWHFSLAHFLVSQENAYARACERREIAGGGITPFAERDFRIFMDLFHYDFSDIEETLGVSIYGYLRDYRALREDHGSWDREMGQIIGELSKRLFSARDETDFREAVERFYRDYGCGMFALKWAFRIRETEAGPALFPVTNLVNERLSDLVGLEIQKRKLIDNTEAFLAGRPANNCLLFGDAGTGKSSSIKGILNAYGDRGLRIIEVYKHQFRSLLDILGRIRDRNYKFIIYMDDLSFEEFETDYKYLKAVIEGGLEKKPDNVLIYATSNRRHLIRENYEDKEGGVRTDMHTSDTVQEKLSLYGRFGVTIYFGAPVKKEYDQIVLELGRRAGIRIPDEELLVGASAFELQHGGRSGRCARQYIDYLMGTGEEA